MELGWLPSLQVHDCISPFASLPSYALYLFTELGRAFDDICECMSIYLPGKFVAVKQRMRSVTNIQKITKAMKMVAASKMRVAQVSTEKARGLIVPLVKSLGDLPGIHLEMLVDALAVGVVEHISSCDHVPLHQS